MSFSVKTGYVFLPDNLEVRFLPLLTIVVDKVFKSNRNKYDKPWITTGLAKACKGKSKLHNIWIKSRVTMKENAAKTNYKSYRSKLKKLIQ